MEELLALEREHKQRTASYQALTQHIEQHKEQIAKLMALVRSYHQKLVKQDEFIQHFRNEHSGEKCRKCGPILGRIPSEPKVDITNQIKDNNNKRAQPMDKEEQEEDDDDDDDDCVFSARGSGTTRVKRRKQAAVKKQDAQRIHKDMADILVQDTISLNNGEEDQDDDDAKHNVKDGLPGEVIVRETPSFGRDVSAISRSGRLSSGISVQNTANFDLIQGLAVSESTPMPRAVTGEGLAVATGDPVADSLPVLDSMLLQGSTDSVIVPEEPVKPDLARAKENLTQAKKYTRSQAWATVANSAQQAIKWAPKDALNIITEASFYCSTAMFKMGQSEESLKQNSFVVENLDHIKHKYQALKQRVVILYSMERYEEAIEYARKALT